MTILILGGGAVGRAIGYAIEGAVYAETTANAATFSCLIPVFSLPPGLPLDAYDETSWAAAAERPLRLARTILQDARRLFDGRGGKIVFALSTTGLQGHDRGLAAAAVVEGIRAMGKSCAMAWAGDDITVNFLAVSREALSDPVRAGAEVAPMIVLLSQTVGAMTASTVVVDNGELMLP